MGCTLVARGENFDVKSFLAKTKLPIKRAHYWIRGTPTLNRKRIRQDSGFSEWVGRDGWENLRRTVANVLKFLQSHRNELMRLKRATGVESIMLDFAFDSRLGIKNVAMQGEYLPPEFLRLAGELNIGIGLSIYPALEEKAPNLRRPLRRLQSKSTPKGSKKVAGGKRSAAPGK